MTWRTVTAAATALLASVSAPAAMDEGVAVGAFKSVVEGGVAAVETTSIYENTRTSKWIKSRNSIRNVTYDVKKTDSLISPLAGIVSFDYLTESGSPADTRESAEAISPDGLNVMAILRKVTLNYAFQEKKWVLKKITYRSLTRAPGETTFKDVLGEDLSPTLSDLTQKTAFERNLFAFAKQK